MEGEDGKNEVETAGCWMGKESRYGSTLASIPQAKENGRKAERQRERERERTDDGRNKKKRKRQRGRTK